MKGSRWLAISVGSLIVALAFWFAILAFASSWVVGGLIFGFGLSFAMYSVAGFSGAKDPMQTGFVAALTALVTASVLVLFSSIGNSDTVFVLAPVAAIGIGGARGLAPTGDKSRNLVRLGATAAVVGVLYFVFTVEVTAFGLVAPLLPLPALGIADRFYDRGREVVAEEI
jgi:hypothetical protein